MSIVGAFIQHLLSIQPLTQIVGDAIDAGLSAQQPISGAQSGMVHVGRSRPRVIALLVSGPRNQSLTGATTAASPRIQVDCWGTTYTQAYEIANAIRHGCDGFRGWMGDTFVDQCLLDDETDNIEPSPGLDAGLTFGRSLDFMFIHQEAIPTGVPVLE